MFSALSVFYLVITAFLTVPLNCAYGLYFPLVGGGFVALKLSRLELSNVRSTEANSGGYIRGVAQFGSAPALGAGGRRFKSCRPDVWGLGNLVKDFPDPFTVCKTRLVN